MTPTVSPEQEFGYQLYEQLQRNAWEKTLPLIVILTIVGIILATAMIVWWRNHSKSE